MVIGIGLALSLFGDATLYAVLPNPDIAAQAGVSIGMVGVLLGINRFTRLLSNGPAGALFDRLPRRGLMIAAMLLGTFSTSLYALGHGAVIMLIARILWGLSWSGIWIGAGTMALDISDEKNRGRINGGLQLGFLLGAALSSFSGGLFTDLFGYRGGLGFSAGLGLAGVLVWWAFLPETRPERTAAAVKTPKQPDEPPVLAAFPWRAVLFTALPLFAMRFVHTGVLNTTTILWLEQFVDEGVTLGGVTLPLATLTGSFIALRVLLSAAGAPLAGALSDRGGRRWGIIAILMVLSFAGIWLMSLPVSGFALAGALLAALAAGGVPSLTGALTGDQVGASQQARALGLLYTVADLGSALGPPVALGLVPLIGIASVYRLTALLALLAAVMALVLAAREPKRRPRV